MKTPALPRRYICPQCGHVKPLDGTPCDHKVRITKAMLEEERKTMPKIRTQIEVVYLKPAQFVERGFGKRKGQWAAVVSGALPNIAVLLFHGSDKDVVIRSAQDHAKAARAKLTVRVLGPGSEVQSETTYAFRKKG